MHVAGPPPYRPGLLARKPAKILLLLATLWPIAYVFVFLAFILSAFLAPAGSPEPPLYFLPLLLLTMLLSTGLTVIYIVDIFRNDRVEKDMKALWALVIFMGSFIAMPIYWYLYIWRTPPSPPSQPAP